MVNKATGNSIVQSGDPTWRSKGLIWMKLTSTTDIKALSSDPKMGGGGVGRGGQSGGGYGSGGGGETE